jgi:hypothetical protein
MAILTRTLSLIAFPPPAGPMGSLSLLSDIPLQYLVLWIAAPVIMCFVGWMAWKAHKRRSEMGQSLAEADVHAAAGRHREALESFLMAEAKWQENTLHPTPKVKAQGLLRLVTIIDGIGRETTSLGRPVETQQLTTSLRLLAELWADKGNHAWGKMELKTEVAARAGHIYKETSRLRAMLRRESEMVLADVNPATQDQSRTSG